MRAEIIQLALKYGRYGYRRITALLQQDGWRVNHKRVERIWWEEGLKVPKKQPKRGRLWLNDGSCVRLRPTHRNHVWSYGFVADRTHDGRSIKMLTIIDEYSRECLAIVTERSLKSDDVLDCLTEMFIRHGAPDITGSIIAGQQPADLSAEKLIRRIDLPLDWSKQRQLLGFI